MKDNARHYNVDSLQSSTPVHDAEIRMTGDAEASRWSPERRKETNHVEFDRKVSEHDS